MGVLVISTTCPPSSPPFSAKVEGVFVSLDVSQSLRSRLGGLGSEYGI
jgi:hypothetical protein